MLPPWPDAYAAACWTSNAANTGFNVIHPIAEKSCSMSSNHHSLLHHLADSSSKSCGVGGLFITWCCWKRTSSRYIGLGNMLLLLPAPILTAESMLLKWTPVAEVKTVVGRARAITWRDGHHGNVQILPSTVKSVQDTRKAREPAMKLTCPVFQSPCSLVDSSSSCRPSAFVNDPIRQHPTYAGRCEG